jgi:NAD(P)-dependent dehydrogenase (short-subunit alcohol dehydrogenase family)
MELDSNPKMQGKICMVTGATSGIGKATALELAKLGATVVVMARDKTKGEATAMEIKRASGNPNLDMLLCDLSSQVSILAAAKEFKDRYKRLNVLINNAGMFTGKRTITSEGFELMFATNYLGPFLLTHLLLPLLEAGKPARIINVTAPSTTKPNFEDLQGERRFSAIRAFGASKAGNLLFTFALARRLKGGVTVNAYFPGIVRTNLMRHAPFPMRIITGVLNFFRGITPERAAEGLVVLASSSHFENTTGQLIHKGKVMASPFINDTATQEQLWQVSERLTGINK